MGQRVKPHPLRGLHPLRSLRSLRPLWRLLDGAPLRPLLLGALLASVTVLSGMALLGLSGWFITATALAGLSASTAFMFDVFMPSAGIRFLAVGRTASRYGERLVTHDATFAVLAALRVRLFRVWARSEDARALLVRPARLLFRLTSDIDALESLYLRLLVPAIAALGAALLAGVILGFMQVGLGIVAALWLVTGGWLLAGAVALRARRPAVRRALAIEALRARTVDLVAGQTDLVMVGRIAAERDLLATADRQLARADLALHRLETAAGAAYGIFGNLTLVGVLLAVAALVGQGAIGVPAAALALLVALTAAEPFAALRRGALDAGRTWLAVKRLAPCTVTEEPGPASSRVVVVDAADAADAASVSPLAVQLRQVVAAHGGGRVEVLQALCLDIRDGERVALVGPSGAGKSTLLAVVAGELAPLSGTAQASASCLLTQRTELFQDTLRDNLRLADPLAADDRLRGVLYAAGLDADVRALARGLDTPLGEGGLGLSGGQSRRLALARLFLRDTPLWLLDEPTDALDAATALDVLHRLGQQAAGHTLLIATHLRREAALADRLVRMEGGRIVADLRRGTDAFEAALNALRPD